MCAGEECICIDPGPGARGSGAGPLDLMQIARGLGELRKLTRSDSSSVADERGLVRRARGSCAVARGVTHLEYGVCALAGTVASGDGGLWEMDAGLCEHDGGVGDSDGSLFAVDGHPSRRGGRMIRRALPLFLRRRRWFRERGRLPGSTGVGVGRLPQDLSQMGPYLSQKGPNGGRPTGWRFVRMVDACPKLGSGACEDSASQLAV
jgi:hypothetical protein